MRNRRFLKKAGGNYWSFFCLVFCLLFSSVEAIIRPSPNAFGFEASYLYWQPISNYPYYASQAAFVNGDFQLQGTRSANEFEFSSGYRLEGIYAFCACDYDIRATWTHLSTSSEESLPLGRYVPTFTTVGSVFQDVPFTIPNNRRSISYNALDVLFEYSFLDCLSFLTINGGLHWAKINFSSKYNFLNVALGTDYTNGEFISRMCGLGPELGLLGKWALPYCRPLALFLNGRIEGAMLVTRINSSAFTVSEVIPTVIVVENIANKTEKNHIVPYWTASIGLSTERTLCLRWSAEIGYAVTGYHHVFDQIGIINPPDGVSTVELKDDVYFHGLYLTLGITY